MLLSRCCLKVLSVWSVKIERAGSGISEPIKPQKFYGKNGGREMSENSRTTKDSIGLAMRIQIGGGHYKDLKIQPIDYILENGLGYCEANVIKYVTRWRSKGGVEDLRKARHYIDILIERECGG